MKKILPIIIALAIVIASLVIYDSLSPKADTYISYAMGSIINTSFYGGDSELNGKITLAIENEERNFLSRYKDTSEIARLNTFGKFTLSPSLTEKLHTLCEISKDSKGAFDITIGSVTSLWNFDSEEFTPPSKQDVQAALSTVDINNLVLGEKEAILKNGAAIDLGAAGKGIACDIAYDILKESDVKGATISVGGTVLTYGESGKGMWKIGIRTPEKDKTDVFMTVTLPGGKFISTSGSYEKCAEYGNQLYHHIISPKTGEPVDNNLKAVTIIADSGLEADALSTALFVMGMEESKDILTKYNAKAVFVTKDNTVYISEDILQSCKLLSRDFEVKSLG